MMNKLQKSGLVLGFLVLLGMLGCQAQEQARSYDLVKYDGIHKPKKEKLRSKVLDRDGETRPQRVLTQIEKAEAQKAGRPSF